MRRLGRYLRLPAAERRLFRRALWTTALLRAGLWLLPFRSLQRVLARPRGAGARLAATPEQIAWAVSAAARYVPRATCLVQALAAQRLCRRAGHATCLRIGVRSGQGAGIEAHAWLEAEGKVLVGGADLDRYTQLLALGQERP